MTAKFYDTHCHFDFPPFTGHEASSLAQAAEAGVDKIIVPAVDAGRFGQVLALAQRYPAIYAALGLHPVAIEHHQQQSLMLLESYLQQRPAKLVAIGEIGLDLYPGALMFERQKALLDDQLILAKRYDLPVILHSRRTHDQLAQHLKRHNLPRTGVVHGFAGSYSQADRFLGLGYYIGVGGTITYPRARKTRDVITRLPLTSLLLETDAPDMPLQGWQGQPNRPERVAEVFRVLCELRPESPDAIANALITNTEAVFALNQTG